MPFSKRAKMPDGGALVAVFASRIAVAPVPRSREGVPVEAAVSSLLPWPPDPTALGEAVRAAVRRSRETVDAPAPGEISAARAAIARTLGATSWDDGIWNDGIAAILSATGDDLRLYVNFAFGNFMNDAERPIPRLDGDATTIGAAVIGALSEHRRAAPRA